MTVLTLVTSRALHGLAKPALIIAVLACTACSVFAPEERRDQVELEHSWRVWQARRADNYRYVQQRLCFCAVESVAPVLVTVSNDVVVDRRFASNDAPVPINLASSWGTIDDLFRLIDRALEMEAASLHVTYHSTLGYPTHISIDYSTNTADDEIVVTATKLEVLATSAR